ncbi:MAG: hypothetical protein K0R15_366 [Clostridiales bacterium]|nr:hypothetical protein [Clostridiales bacterium]
MNIGFDNNKYIKMQSKYILERIEKFNNKLYLEFGGKLFDDYHASRVLPGFAIDAKIRLLQELKDKTEIIICINAGDIEKNKIRADLGITYDQDVLRLIDNLRSMGLLVSGIVIAQYKEQPAATIYIKKLEMRGEKTYIHRPIAGYPLDIDHVVSENGYGQNDFVETTRPLVVVTAPGPGSGKMATCLSQLYHENKRGIKAGYSKFETFPIWNKPLKHPVNLAYEAATADLNDVNMIDPFHLEAYGITTINYNRDIEVFPVVKTILEKITGTECIYKSPTDMGVNMAGNAISDDEIVSLASKQEIVRRYYKTACDYKQGRVDIETVEKIEFVMKQANISLEDRAVVLPALEKAKLSETTAMSIQLPNGKIVTGKSSPLMSCAASVLLNAIKELAGLSDEILLISAVVLEPIKKMKAVFLGAKNPTLTAEEVLITLSISAATSPIAEIALKKLSMLKHCEAHCTCMLPVDEEAIYRKLGINYTSEPEYCSSGLYIQ